MSHTIDRRLHNRATLGIFLMIIGLALYAFSDAFLKHLMGTYSVNQTTFLRAVTRIAPLFIAVFFQGGVRHTLGTTHAKRHLFRLIINLGSTYAFMCAFKFSSLTAIYTLGYTSPFFMIILSALLLRETVSWDRWLAVVVGMLGIIIAVQPGSNVFEWASIIVLSGAFLAALNKILMRNLAQTEHALAISIYPNIAMIFITLPLICGSWISMPWSHWALFAFVGTLTAAAQYSIAQAVRYTKASTLAPIDYSTYFWVVSLDFLWWNQTPEMRMVIGAATIVCSNLYILYTTRREETLKTAPNN